MLPRSRLVEAPWTFTAKPPNLTKEDIVPHTHR
jgi:hypothetical protein